MTTKNDGGPAFPGAVNHAAPPGMSLRDWFAGQAMIAITNGGNGWVSPADITYLASRAYEVADALISEREK